MRVILESYMRTTMHKGYRVFIHADPIHPPIMVYDNIDGGYLNAKHFALKLCVLYIEQDIDADFSDFAKEYV